MWRWVALVLSTLASQATAHAQPRFALEVDGAADGCVTQAALGPRVAHWLKPDADVHELSVAVRAREAPLRFTLRRSGQPIAQRSFEVLPTRCADRLEAVAIAIALALEHAAGNPEWRETEAGTGTGSGTGTGAGAAR
jgi:hypothetical protein